MLSPLLKTFLLSLAFANHSKAWEVSSYAIVKSITTGLIPDYNQSTTVELTAPLTVSPLTKITTVRNDYFVATENGGGRAVVNVTFVEVRLPTDVDLPTSTSGAPNPDTTSTSSIQTHYYVPATVSNPTSCTKTKFTYTDSIGVKLPTYLTTQVPDSSLVEHMTTYVSTISTNLGGQAVTTSRCDVYFKSGAVPVIEGDIGVDGDYYLSQCVDPRREVCTLKGENSAAKGDGGCKGDYPPTGTKNDDASSTEGSPTGATQTDGAGSWSEQRNWGLAVILPCCIVLSLLLN